LGSGGAPATKVAPTVAAAGITMTQAEPPEQAPFQPVKLDPTPPFAPNATALPSGNVAEQIVPQLIPAGLVRTVPSPVTVTFSVCTPGAPLPVPDPDDPHAAATESETAARSRAALLPLPSPSFIAESSSR